MIVLSRTARHSAFFECQSREPNGRTNGQNGPDGARAAWAAAGTDRIAWFISSRQVTLAPAVGPRSNSHDDGTSDLLSSHMFSAVKPASPECGHPFMRKIDWNMPKENLPRFCIDMYEFPNQPGGQPTTCLTYGDAEKLCTDAGKRLCTSKEWETACVGKGSCLTSCMYVDNCNHIGTSICGTFVV